MNDSKVTCPNCNAEIDVNSIISHQLEEQYKQKYQEQLNKERQKFNDQQESIKSEKEALEKARNELTEELNRKLNEKLVAERERIIMDTRQKLGAEQAQAISDLNRELEDKSQKLKDLNSKAAEVERLKREKNELRETIEAEKQKELNDRLAAEKEIIKKNEEEKNELKIKELLQQLETQKKLTEEMKRKQDQGSMQLQGEVQELAIEEWLRAKFPLDTIAEIKKGDRGADCLQTVNSYHRPNYGSIYYESKRTKKFDTAWLGKLKDDMRIKNANIGVLVTDTFPKDVDRMTLIDGIWVCSYPEFKGLCMVLRQSLIQLGDAIASQENKGDKMNMLYEYLVGNEFRSQVEAIVEGFTQMQIELIAEKKSIESHWKKREKQIEKVLKNTIHMYSSIKGIAGAAIQPIQLLELPPNVEKNDEV
jgi:hypothetical protein